MLVPEGRSRYVETDRKHTEQTSDAATISSALATAVPTAGADGPDGPVAPPKVSPNPSTGRSTVTFSVAEAGDVRAAVYDLLGREVAVLADGPLAPGLHHVTIEARSLPAGVYVVHVAAGARVQTARFTVVR